MSTYVLEKIYTMARAEDGRRHVWGIYVARGEGESISNKLTHCVTPCLARLLSKQSGE